MGSKTSVLHAHSKTYCSGSPGLGCFSVGCRLDCDVPCSHFEQNVLPRETCHPTDSRMLPWYENTSHLREGLTGDEQDREAKFVARSKDYIGKCMEAYAYLLKEFNRPRLRDKARVEPIRLGSFVELDAYIARTY